MNSNTNNQTADQSRVDSIKFPTSASNVSEHAIPAVPQNFQPYQDQQYVLQRQNGFFGSDEISPIGSTNFMPMGMPYQVVSGSPCGYPMGFPGLSPPLSPPISPPFSPLGTMVPPGYTAVTLSPPISPTCTTASVAMDCFGNYSGLTGGFGGINNYGGYVEDPFTGQQVYIPHPNERSDVPSSSHAETPMAQGHHPNNQQQPQGWPGPQQAFSPNSSQSVLDPHSQPFEGGNTTMYIVAAAMDRVQGLLLQQTIADCRASKDQDKLQSMFYEILPNILKVAQDPCGNFVLQRLIEAIEDKKLVDVSIERIRKDIVQFAKNQYGCRVFQSILERCTNEGRLQILDYLYPDIGEILKNNFGCYVIQKMIETIEDPKDLSNFIDKYIMPECFELSVEANGCRVMQDVFRYCTTEQKLKLTQELLSYILDLSKDNFGNYVVQNVLHYGTPEIRAKVIQALFPHILTIGCNKAGSNILEKCFAKCPRNLKGQLTDSVIQDKTTLAKLVRNRYGNYVVQKMLTCLPAKEKSELVQSLEDHFKNLEKLNDHEQHVYNQIHRQSHRNNNNKSTPPINE